MEESERLVGHVKGVESSGGHKGTYNLYITDKRIVAIDAAMWTSGLGAIALMTGPLGIIIGESLSRKRGQTKELTLDEMLAQDKKKSFALRYEDTVQIYLLDPHSLFGKRKLEIKALNSSETFLPDEEEFEKISHALHSINSLKGRIEG